MKEFVKVQDITKTYKMGEVEIHAVDHISFSIEQGELVVIVGPSGAGKTTVLNILGGMDTATSGKLYVDGKETEPETFAEAFISVLLTDGKHDIELIYTTPGLKTGAMISLGCLMLFLLSAFWRGKQEKNIVVSESLC